MSDDGWKFVALFLVAVVICIGLSHCVGPSGADQCYADRTTVCS